MTGLLFYIAVIVISHLNALSYQHTEVLPHNPQRLLIFFNNNEQEQSQLHHTYSCDQALLKDTAYLFLWGQEADSSQDYAQIIHETMIMCHVPCERTFTSGTGMGGYHALLYATLVGLKAAIVINPVVDHYLLHIMESHPTIPDVSLVFGYKKIDKTAGYALIEKLKANKKTSILRRSSRSNVMAFKAFIAGEINYFEKQVTLTEVEIKKFQEERESYESECVFPNRGFSVEKMSSIKATYEHTLFGKEHLFYPGKHPQRLLIFFSGALKNRYNMWTFFWREDEDWGDTAYLFLKDDEMTWYVGNNKKPFFQDYRQIIKHYLSLSKLTEKNAFTIGCSMGGYGALLYATRLGFRGAIIINAQINKVCNQGQFPVDNAQGQWEDVDKVIRRASFTPHVSFIFSRDLYDEKACYALLDSLKDKDATVVIRRDESRTHAPLCPFSKLFIEHEIEYLENQITL